MAFIVKSTTPEKVIIGQVNTVSDIDALVEYAKLNGFLGFQAVTTDGRYFNADHAEIKGAEKTNWFNKVAQDVKVEVTDSVGKAKLIQEKVNGLKGQLNEYKEKVESLKARNYALERELDDANAENVELQDRNDALLEELEKVRAELKETKETLAAKTAECEALIAAYNSIVL